MDFYVKCRGRMWNGVWKAWTKKVQASDEWEAQELASLIVREVNWRQRNPNVPRHPWVSPLQIDHAIQADREVCAWGCCRLRNGD